MKAQEAIAESKKKKMHAGPRGSRRDHEQGKIMSFLKIRKGTAMSTNHEYNSLYQRDNCIKPWRITHFKVLRNDKKTYKSVKVCFQTDIGLLGSYCVMFNENLAAIPLVWRNIEDLVGCINSEPKSTLFNDSSLHRNVGETRMVGILWKCTDSKRIIAKRKEISLILVICDHQTEQPSWSCNLLYL